MADNVSQLNADKTEALITAPQTAQSLAFLSSTLQSHFDVPVYTDTSIGISNHCLVCYSLVGCITTAGISLQLYFWMLCFTYRIIYCSCFIHRAVE